MSMAKRFAGDNFSWHKFFASGKTRVPWQTPSPEWRESVANGDDASPATFRHGRSTSARSLQFFAVDSHASPGRQEVCVNRGISPPFGEKLTSLATAVRCFGEISFRYRRSHPQFGGRFPPTANAAKFVALLLCRRSVSHSSANVWRDDGRKISRQARVTSPPITLVVFYLLIIVMHAK